MNSQKAIAFMILMIGAIVVTGCHKTDEPDDEGNNNGGNDTVVAVHQFVDLGLASGTLWATCNVGANSPEEYGDYFAWGETVPKDVYSWSNYQYGDTLNGHFAMNKYCSDSEWGYHWYVDSLTILEPMDDAATANWGADWRMPTKEEYEELYQNTSWVWTEINGVEGRLMTGPNGNSVFFPATGFYLDHEVICPGLGIYWSNTLQLSCPERGWSLHFDWESCHVCGTYERCRGQVVRAVRAAK